MLFTPVSMARSALDGPSLTAKHAAADASKARATSALLEADVEKLFMITEALWSILKEHHGYTDEHLVEMIENVDLKDGTLDGRVAKQQNPDCPQCGRVLIGKHNVCLYCGAAVERAPFER